LLLNFLFLKQIPHGATKVLIDSVTNPRDGYPSLLVQGSPPRYHFNPCFLGNQHHPPSMLAMTNE